ncbi:MAG TPA: sensor histidine kinase [Anaerolineales bacterium]|jgi:signal transduction histidine kinase|nr:sensor histidine kinase [Anaerolineales bacterium]
MAAIYSKLVQRPRAALFLAVSYILWASVTIRWITEFVEQNHPLLPLISAMLVLFGMLMGLEPLITQGSTWWAHLYLIFQTSLIFIASLFYFELDFFAILYLPLCGQAMFLFPRRTSMVWVSILILATFAGQTIQFGWPGGLSFTLLYIGGLIFVTAFSVLTIQADESRQRSERLLDELREAHRQLQAYAGQAEELAVAKERNRLARDLHDSVAQTLYGLTLQSEAASRQLASGHLDKVGEYLGEIRQSAQQTLQEARLLIFELRPPILEKDGLSAALRARLEDVEGRSGLKTHVNLDEVGRLPSDVETGLYRIGQEALNNILKHAQAGQVWLNLTLNQTKVSLEIVDDGMGFDPAAAHEQGGMGLEGMQARAEQIGANFRMQSERGEGTRVKVEVPL